MWYNWTAHGSIILYSLLPEDGDEGVEKKRMG